MKTFPLFNKSSAFDGIYLVFMLSRLQMLYYMLIMPTILVDPYMIWVIILVGAVSQLILIMISKWFSSEFAAKGYLGFVELFGERTVRILAFLGLGLILLKLSVHLLGYVEIVHQFIFFSMKPSWLIFFVLLISCYIASKGVENTIRYSVIAFLCTIWMLFLFIPFYTPPIAFLHDLYPLIPTEWSGQSWRGLLLIMASFSGAEYVLFLSPWFKRDKKTVKYFSVANGITIFEYVFLFIASLLFYGANYLSKSSYPLVNMVRYLQSPLFERIDMIVIAMFLIHFSFAIGLLLLLLYGGVRIAGGNQNQPTRIGFAACAIVVFITMIIMNELLWKDHSRQTKLIDLQMWIGAATYLLVPVVLLAALKRKGRT
ncbi:GerAB/ArcD/ProY family transporter [Jeotgalibacillus soli]|uniref:Spore germination protein n=1 Tax=Jeotgalibacillus soli TaxID=889306 RepID=A0A0C2W5S6_9BACL|nr:GerAB/ArcD/ProY family transporter [Jeotgalibacillus soli]KIL51931.1 hypothetical protein KP78_03010 [Jeotgalibacillus soli]